ncbi:hypothetical protein [Streptomyces sp. NBC_00019]|uniref:hypothetical protein n=1 Tax=Streptomyces sp. NBC_00019 TaxID=2975623 RepID=UPI0032562513
MPRATSASPAATRSWRRLHALFERGRRSGARVALRGLSGVGKSQIANEYSHRVGNYYDIVW